MRAPEPLSIVLLLSLTGCIPDIAGWSRTDRRALDARKLEIDQTICRGEVDRSALITSDARESVYEGCMAGRGYLPIRR